MGTWVGIGSSGSIRVRVPTIVRYMEERFVDAFFADGSLRLSSFAAFREHSDESKRDAEEGTADIELTNPNAHGVYLIVAPPCYVLCSTSNQFDPGSVSWNTSVGLRILDPLQFAECVAAHIPGFAASFQGACDYTDGPDVDVRSREQFISPDKHPAGPEGYFRDHQKVIAELTKDGLFSKARRFCAESEYRIICSADGVDPSGYLDIKCPDAIQFCERVDTRPATAGASGPR